jgi:hypothetical protein
MAHSRAESWSAPSGKDGLEMTYCLGIKVRDGLVCLSDGPWLDRLVPRDAGPRLTVISED